MSTPKKASKSTVKKTVNKITPPVPKSKPRSKDKPTNSPQMEFFQPGPACIPVMVPIQVPMGVPITFGTPETTLPAEVVQDQSSLTAAMKAILSLPREELREVIIASGAKANQVINLATTCHGLLYRLAAIGGKVTQRGPRGPQREDKTE